MEGILNDNPEEDDAYVKKESDLDPYNLLDKEIRKDYHEGKSDRQKDRRVEGEPAMRKVDLSNEDHPDFGNKNPR